MVVAPASMFETPTGAGVSLSVVGTRILARDEHRRDGYRAVPVFRVDPLKTCIVCLGRGGTWAENVRQWTPCWHCAGAPA